MFWKILGLLVLAWLIYSGLPAIYFKYIRKESHGGKGALLTFDDGPNPKTTPLFLDALEEGGEKANFFVIGRKVQAYPEIVHRAQAHGHTIGLHCYDHGQPAFWTPWKTRRDIRQAMQALNSIGVHPSYYRPPHGWVNLSMLVMIRRYGLKLRLWNRLPGDWEEDKPWEETYQALVKEDQAGGVVCIHDSNDHWDSPSQAPFHTLKAVKKFLAEKNKLNWKKTC